ncbi:23S rRNA (guanosine(2251)-2'-O)-methyltransferase RlmB [Caldicellulosiruptor changbaiensis]|uniref:23S rRNA (Guanosine(2251)-2'-O)-methyltransferase RlmB n=1 Tax=Caldicellulosiruptor changbaiensis TaxID=1222016 RepID=A0A3T0D4A6_9FIRM|nr:23S rRNA (guanosine(2251)-2'-O)-methyltransferase RlmB [Caldicellulosiruptor changbaiensis]AZT89879.1 23S rRNA (guanosine(2251)-2'-O)-methyltransferase RlmB [Caldicellulosiruptor changbaiensis]
MRTIEGKNPVKEALNSSTQITEVYISNTAKDKSISEIINLCKQKGVVVKFVDKSKIDKMSKTKNPQGVIAIAQEYKYWDIDDLLLEAANKGEKPFLVLLDEITDPHNFGSIIRSAHLCGAHGIIIEARNSCPITPTVEKASAGAIEHIKVARVVNLRRTIDELKQKGIWVYAADNNATKLLYDCDFKIPMCIVIGSEGKGVSRLVKEGADFLVKIPQKGKVNSYNASVAAGIIFFEVLKQRIEEGERKGALDG